MFTSQQDSRDNATTTLNAGPDPATLDQAAELRIEIAVKDMVVCLSTAGDGDHADGQSVISVRRFASGGVSQLGAHTAPRPAAAPEWPRH